MGGFPEYRGGHCAIGFMSEEDVKEWKGAVCFSFYCELDVAIDGVEVVMEKCHSVSGEDSAGVITVHTSSPSF